LIGADWSVMQVFIYTDQRSATLFIYHKQIILKCITSYKFQSSI